MSRPIHKGLRPCEKRLVIANPPRANERAKLLAVGGYGPAMCQILNHGKSYVVSGRSIPAAWIAQSDDKPH